MSYNLEIRIQQLFPNTFIKLLILHKIQNYCMKLLETRGTSLLKPYAPIVSD